jgi:hypothetical protein
MAKTTAKTVKAPIKTVTVTDVIKVTTGIGDTLATQFDETGDIKVVSVSLDAYKTAISGSKAQLIYKKLTGKPTSIPFLED